MRTALSVLLNISDCLSSCQRRVGRQRLKTPEPLKEPPRVSKESQRPPQRLLKFSPGTLPIPRAQAVSSKFGERRGFDAVGDKELAQQVAEVEQLAVKLAAVAEEAKFRAEAARIAKSKVRAAVAGGGAASAEAAVATENEAAAEAAVAAAAAEIQAAAARLPVAEGAEAASGGTGKAFKSELSSRATVLVSLMVVQSLSGIILGNFLDLIQNHVVVTLFLTMLVGAGGNAGNQATVSLIQRLAREKNGRMARFKELSILLREGRFGLLLGVLLCSVAFLRVLFSCGDLTSAIAIGVTAFFIVFISVMAGAAMPLGLVHIGVDAVHAGPAIQVLMDIIGVFLTCNICSAIFGMFNVGASNVASAGLLFTR